MKLTIIEEFWGINHVTGESSVICTDKRTFDPIVGKVLKFSKGRRCFTIDAVDNDSITMTVHYSNEAFNKTWIINKGNTQFYRPLSMDGGYQYHLIYRDENA